MLKLKYNKEHELVMYENTRADSKTDRKPSIRQLAGLIGERKKFNANFIVNIDIFLYN